MPDGLPEVRHYLLGRVDRFHLRASEGSGFFCGLANGPMAL